MKKYLKLSIVLAMLPFLSAEVLASPLFRPFALVNQQQSLPIRLNACQSVSTTLYASANSGSRICKLSFDHSGPGTALPIAASFMAPNQCLSGMNFVVVSNATCQLPAEDLANGNE